MEVSYIKDYQVRWSDLDGNSHMKNTSYLEYASQTRMSYFFDMGFPPKRMMETGVGPVAVRDEIFYFKEIQLMETFRVSLFLDGESADQTRMKLINIFINQNEQVIAKVISDGVWFDLISRRIISPPDSIKELMLRLPRSDSFKIIAD